MRGQGLLLLGLLLPAASSAAACAAVLGYDSGSPEPDGGSVGADAPQTDAPMPKDGSTDGSTDHPTSDAPQSDSSLDGGGMDTVAFDSVSSDSSPVDGRPSDTANGDTGTPDVGAMDSQPLMDAPNEQDASITCASCPGASTLYVYPPTAGQLRGIAVDPTAGTVYWALAPSGGGGSVVSCSSSVCTSPTTVAQGTDVDTPTGIALSPSTVYWSNDTTGGAAGVYACSRAGCTPSLFVATGPSEGLAFDGTPELYVGLPAGALDQCTVTPMQCGVTFSAGVTAGIYGVAASTTYVYWGFATTASAFNLYAAQAINNASTQAFYADSEAVAGVALRGGSSKLYWVTQAGSLRSCSVSGTTPCTAATTHLQGGLPSPFGMATDGTSLFITVSSPTGNGVLVMPAP